MSIFRFISQHPTALGQRVGLPMNPKALLNPALVLMNMGQDLAITL